VTCRTLILNGIFFLLLAAVCACTNGTSDTRRKVNQKKEPRTSVYFGEMHYLPETREFYTPIFLNPDLESQEPESLLPLLDSTVISNPTMTRKRFPMDRAKEFFMLADIDSLYVYDTEHTRVSRAALQRVEYLDDHRQPGFVAVYRGEPLHTDPAEEYYGMSDTLQSLYVSDFSQRTMNDPSLNSFLLHRLKPKDNVVPEIRNIEIGPSGAVYSVITSPEASYITELKDGQFSILKEMNVRYRVDHILPLPYDVNGKPLQLVTMYIPGAPGRVVSLAVFADFQEYRILHYNRLQLKKPEREVEFRFGR
jgi:hypothetical protein